MHDSLYNYDFLKIFFT